MKKKVLLVTLGLAFALSACTSSADSGGGRGNLEDDIEDDTEEADPYAENGNKEEYDQIYVEDEDGGHYETVPQSEDEPEPTSAPDDYCFWEYEGFLDEAADWLAYKNEDFRIADYDGDMENDRIYRKFDDEQQMAYYTIVFGNGNTFNIPAAWYTGFPHVTSADFDQDGELEILFTQTYDTSTDPTMAGDMWIFDPDGRGGYKEVVLDCFRSEAHGERYLSIEYGESAEDTIPFKIIETGFEAVAEVGVDYIEGYWIQPPKGETYDIHICSANAWLMGGKAVIECKAGILNKSGLMLGFDLVYNDQNDKYEIRNMRFPSDWEW